MSIVGDLVGVAEPLAAVDDEMGRVLACGSVGMIVARQFCRKTKMTKTTSSSASKNVMRTSSMDVLM